MPPLADWLLDRALLIFAVWFFIFVIYKSRIRIWADSLVKTIKKASEVFMNNAISDHWKEKSILLYSRIIFRHSFNIFLLLVLASIVLLAEFYFRPVLYIYTMTAPGILEVSIYSIVIFLIFRYLVHDQL